MSLSVVSILDIQVCICISGYLVGVECTATWSTSPVEPVYRVIVTSAASETATSSVMRWWQLTYCSITCLLVAQSVRFSGSSSQLVIHFHSLSFIFIHFHSLSFTFIHFHSLSFTFIHFHSLSFIFIHFHSLSFTFIYFHSLSFTFIHFHSLSFIFIHFHSLSFTFISSLHPLPVPLLSPPIPPSLTPRTLSLSLPLRLSCLVNWVE